MRCFCIFEGIDGSGKSTLLKKTLALAVNNETCRTAFDKIVELKEPTDGPEGRIIRSRMQNHEKHSRDEWLEMFLSDRAWNVRENIRKAQNCLILQDRYFYSTAAYQGDVEEPPTAREIVQKNLDRNFPEPDIIFYISVTPDEAFRRITERGSLETFEKREMLEKIEANYWTILPAGTVFLDGKKDPEILAQKTLDTILDFVRANQ